MKRSVGGVPDRDREWIRCIRTGGKEGAPAIHALYSAYRSSVLSHLRKHIHLFPSFRGHADDVLHESFLLLLRKIERGDTIRSTLPGLWQGIGYYLIKNDTRRDQKIFRVEDAESGYLQSDLSPDHDLLAAEKRQEVLGLFAGIGVKCKQVLLLWVEHHSMEDIAAALQLSGPAMARKIKYDCMKRIKELVRNSHKVHRS